MKIYRFGDCGYDLSGGIPLFENFMIDYIIARGEFTKGSTITDTQYGKYVYDCLMDNRYLDWNRAQMRIKAKFTSDFHILMLFSDLMQLSDSKLRLFLSWCLGYCLLERVPKDLQSQLEEKLVKQLPRGNIYRFVRQRHIPLWEGGCLSPT